MSTIADLLLANETLMRQRDEVVGLLQDLCAYLERNANGSVGDVREWLADRIPGSLPAAAPSAAPGVEGEAG